MSYLTARSLMNIEDANDGVESDAAPCSPSCCFCGTESQPLMDIGTPSFELDGELVPAFCYAEAWMLSAGTNELHACEECFTQRTGCMGRWTKQGGSSTGSN